MIERDQKKNIGAVYPACDNMGNRRMTFTTINFEDWFLKYDSEPV